MCTINRHATRTGQISIDYIAGALIFLGAVLFLMSTILNTVPEVEQIQEEDDLQLTAWGLSEVVMHDTGYWTNGSADGTDWHRHVANTTTLGLQHADSEGEGVSMQKLDTLRDLPTETLHDILGTDRSVNIAFTLLADIDTYRSFRRGNPPGFLTEPSYQYPPSTPVQYGSATLNGTQRYVLLADENEQYTQLYTSTSWDFSDSNTTFHNLTEETVITIDEIQYLVDRVAIQISDGNVLLLRRDLGRAGAVPPASTNDIVQIKRYNTVNGNVLEAVFRVWR